MVVRRLAEETRCGVNPLSDGRRPAAGSRSSSPSEHKSTKSSELRKRPAVGSRSSSSLEHKSTKSSKLRKRPAAGSQSSSSLEHKSTRSSELLKHSRTLFSLPPVTIIEVEDEVPIERMDAAALEDVSVEEVAPLVVVVVEADVGIQVSFASLMNPMIGAHSSSTWFRSIERLSSKFSLGVERRRRGGRSVSSWIGLAGDKDQSFRGRYCTRTQRTTEYSRRK